MLITDLLIGIRYTLFQGSEDLNVKSIAWDSRKVENNSLFICVKSKSVDRHDFALEAIEAGAKALIVEREVPGIPDDITVINVEDTRKAMAVVAGNFYGNPSHELNVIGITGTNGKTSVAWIVAKLLELGKRKSGIIGTIDNTIGEQSTQVEKLNPTTPDALELQGTLREMLDAGVTDVAVEVTSIALEYHRVDNCAFRVGVFTNLTPDHLDEHGDMNRYKNAKLKLFKMCRYAVINADDVIFDEIVESSICEKIWSYGIDQDADFKASDLSYTETGVKFVLHFKGNGYDIHLKTPGKFSVYNALAGIGACYAAGMSIEDIVKFIQTIGSVKGRFEPVFNKKGTMTIVDYAHTPDGLENILSAVRAFGKRKVIVVFGCGGDRDKSKRPVMGEIAGRLADLCILTSDNPRSENPYSIISEIESGIKRSSESYEIIEDRKEAIYRALDIADSEDVVVIAGKGHESYQIYSDRIIPFDDGELVRNYDFSSRR